MTRPCVDLHSFAALVSIKSLRGVKNTPELYRIEENMQISLINVPRLKIRSVTMNLGGDKWKKKKKKRKSDSAYRFISINRSIDP